MRVVHTHSTSSRNKGQSMVEMALVLPILLLLVLGVFELGRAVFIFSAVNNASREAARFGASTGASGGGEPRYLDCDSIRQQARDTAFLSGLTAGDIEIAYDRPNASGGMTVYGTCVGGTAVFTSGGSIEPSDVQLGDRVLVTVTRDIAPISGFIPLPDFSPTFVTARTILKAITIGPVECGDGVDNDGDGLTDYDSDPSLGDPGCSGPDDTTEAFCYRLSLVAAPADGGTMSANPGTNCSNRYIEGTTVHLEALAAPRYEFEQWSGSHSTTNNPTSLVMDSDKDIIAEFRPLQADIVVDKYDTVDPIGVKEDFTYSIEVTNPITDDATSVRITDTLPAGVTYQNWSHSFDGVNPNCTPSPGRVVCTLDSLLQGQRAVFDLEVEAPSSPGTITNTVTGSAFEFDPDPLNNDDVETTEVIPITDLWLIDKADSADPVNAASQYDYSIGVGNNGPSPATGVVVTDTLPSGVSFVSSADGCTASSSIVTCPITGTLSAGATLTVTFTVQAPNNVPNSDPTVVNLAQVAGNETDRNMANNSGEEETTVLNRANLTLDKTGPATATRDQEFDYSLTVTNNGPSTAQAVTVSDTLPASFNTVDYSNPAGSCDITGNPVTCDLGDMLASDSHTIVLTVTPTEEGSFTNTAAVSSTTTDPSSSNNTGSATTSVEADVGLAIDKSAPGTATEGESFDYTISVTNNGPSNANNVTVVDTLPDGVAFSSASAGCSYNSTAHEVVCTYSELVATLSTNFTISVTPETTGDVTNTANVTSDEDTTGVSDSATTTVDPTLDLSLTKNGPESAQVGVAFDYTLNVANSGPSTATSVEVVDFLPSGLDYGDVQVTGSSDWICEYDTTAHDVICTIPEFVGGDEATITITVTPTADAAGNSVFNEATVTAAESNYDTNGVNDTGNESTPVEL